MVRHLDHGKGEPCSLCESEQRYKDAVAANAQTEADAHDGFIAGRSSEPSALLNMLKGPKELVYEDNKRQVTRIPGTSITISRRRKS